MNAERGPSSGSYGSHGSKVCRCRVDGRDTASAELLRLVLTGLEALLEHGTSSCCLPKFNSSDNDRKEGLALD